MDSTVPSVRDTTDLSSLAKALVALQADLTPVAKTASNPFFKSSYAPLPEVMQSVQPLLAKHKLAVSQFMTSLNGESALRTILIHESGQFIEDVSPLLLAKTDPQGQGSAVTYARRYGLMAVLGLVADEDDDGNAASTPSAPRTTQTASTAPVKSEPKTTGNRASVKQLGFIKANFGKLGITDRDEMVEYCSNVILREITSSTEMTLGEAKQVIDAQLEELGGAQ